MARTFLQLLILLLLPAIAGADGTARQPAELRFGILSHDTSLWHSRREEGIDLNLELRFPSPDISIFRTLASPAPTWAWPSMTRDSHPRPMPD